MLRRVQLGSESASRQSQREVQQCIMQRVQAHRIRSVATDGSPFGAVLTRLQYLRCVIPDADCELTQLTNASSARQRHCHEVIHTQLVSRLSA